MLGPVSGSGKTSSSIAVQADRAMKTKHKNALRPGMMKFSRQSRLLKAAEFKTVFQQPIRSSDDCFRVLARVNGIPNHRLGMAVSKKACARAVGRNRIKRVVRENFRAKMVGSATGNTLDFVVLPTAQAKSQSNKVLDESLTAHWQRLTRKVVAGIPANRKTD